MSPKNKRSWIAVAVVIALVAIALVVNRVTTEKHAASGSPNRAELVAAANLPDCPTTTGSAGADGGLPELTLPCLGNGPKVNLAKLRGPAVLNIWAGTCPPCRAEAPQLAKFAAATSGTVTVLGVVDGAYVGETWDDALDASRGLGLGYPSVFDAKGELVRLVRSGGIPVTLFVGRDGKVAYTKIGELGDGELAALAKQHLGVSS